MEIDDTRKELVNLNNSVRKQARLIENVENGFYSNGIRSIYLPKDQRVSLPNRDHFP